jgi:hypothetical protein
MHDNYVRWRPGVIGRRGVYSLFERAQDCQLSPTVTDRQPANVYNEGIVCKLPDMDVIRYIVDLECDSLGITVCG